MSTNSRKCKFQIVTSSSSEIQRETTKNSEYKRMDEIHVLPKWLMRKNYNSCRI